MNKVKQKQASKNPTTCNKKVEREIVEILNTTDFENLIGKEILYWIKDDHKNGCVSWAKVLGLSPNKKFVKLTDIDGHDNTPYYRGVSQTEVVDILTQGED